MEKKLGIVLIITVFLLCCGFAAKLALDKVNVIYGKLDKISDDISSGIDVVSYNTYVAGEKLDGVRYNLAKEYRNYNFDYSWTENNPPLVAHALGEIDQISGSNSREAFIKNYEAGHRIFEADFYLTEPENTLVLAHDAELWRAHTKMEGKTGFSYQNFKSAKLYERYTSMDYKDIVDLLSEYEDAYLITDTKFLDSSSVFLQFSQLVRYAQDCHPEVLDRIIPQIYHEDMLSWVMDVYPFSSVVYTLYASAWTEDSVCDFCKATGVGYVTMRDAWAEEKFISRLDEMGVITAAHTVNDIEAAQELYDIGVNFIYTDSIVPEQLS